MTIPIKLNFIFEACKYDWKYCFKRNKTGKGLDKDMYKWPMGMDSGVGVDCGNQGWVGWREAKGKKLGQLQ